VVSQKPDGNVPVVGANNGGVGMYGHGSILSA
jgi:hypothetical protein